MSEELRTNERIRSFLRGQIIFNNRMSTIECIIKNISSTGAKIALSDTLAVPNEFEVYIPNKRRGHRARLVWRDKDSIGVHFTEPQRAEKPHIASQPSTAETPASRLHELEVQNAQLKARIRELSKRLEDLGQDPNIVAA
jgi:hypothetical protein